MESGRARDDHAAKGRCLRQRAQVGGDNRVLKVRSRDWIPQSIADLLAPPERLLGLRRLIHDPVGAVRGSPCGGSAPEGVRIRSGGEPIRTSAGPEYILPEVAGRQAVPKTVPSGPLFFRTPFLGFTLAQ